MAFGVLVLVALVAIVLRWVLPPRWSRPLAFVWVAALILAAGLFIDGMRHACCAP